MLGIIAIILSALSAILDIAGLAVPYWYSGTVLSLKAHFGLWKSCASSICASIPDAPGALNGTRACEILGMLLLFAALAAAVLKQFVMKDKPILTKLGGGCAIFGGVLMIIGTIIFATDSSLKLLGTGMHLHAGFGLCIVAGILALPAGIVMFLNKD
ncbi:uncharacterized protein LOC123560394 [Mercenaria mercenaria]|uniref:uncharacterized protein LOC123560394 n=1 Tax=Mercenaria mercenaria TaxID=6596 RepID=UPI001E1DD068|nr:uncharacterized protein LOC123560394 [Mercenaria mercenaria]